MQAFYIDLTNFFSALFLTSDADLTTLSLERKTEKEVKTKSLLTARKLSIATNFLAIDNL